MVLLQHLSTHTMQELQGEKEQVIYLLNVLYLTLLTQHILLPVLVFSSVLVILNPLFTSQNLMELLKLSLFLVH